MRAHLPTSLLLAALCAACTSEQASLPAPDAGSSPGAADAASSGQDAAADDDAAADAAALPDAAAQADDAAAPDADLEDASPVADGGPADVGVPGDAGSNPAGDPGLAGPYSVTEQSAQVQRNNRTTPLSAYVPSSTAGQRFPLVLFLPGFRLDSVRYAALCERVASHGFVVVRADPPASLVSTNHVEMAADAMAVLDWALDANSPIAGAVDGAQVGVMGHSLGGKISTMVAHDDPRVRALLGIDPVNGGSPIGGYSMTLPDIVPDALVGMTIPVGFAGETTNATGGIGGQACAPMDQNFVTFYDAATSAVWAASFDFTGADHMDFVDDTTRCGFVCSACTDGTADPLTVAEDLHRLAVAFFRRHLSGEAAMETYLTGAMAPASIVVQHRP